MNDPSHKAMLYFLELLMNSDGPMTLTQLATRFFSSKTFTPEMREACGRTTEGLRRFLNRYPSLFNVEGSTITAVAVDLPTPTVSSRMTNGGQPRNSSPDSQSLSSVAVNQTSSSSSSSHDFGQETEAVKFFHRQLLKRDDRWVTIRSLAGHLSQASSEIRAVVGPQLDFYRFLLRHPHVFEIQGELVSLKDTIFSSSIPRKAVRNPVGPGLTSTPKSRPARPKSLFIPGMAYSDEIVPHTTSAPSSPIELKPAPLSMSAKEYKSVLFLRQTVLVKSEGSLPLVLLFSELAKSTDEIQSVVGSTMVELEQFIRKHSLFFDMLGSSAASLSVSCRADVSKINVIITSGRSGDHSSTRTLTNQRGSVFHVAKLWGIIDLGGHEHVFFDKSIFKHLDDLQKHFKKDEPVYFNAILAAKGSRAKWRATQVWKESDRGIMETLSTGRPSSTSGELVDEGLELSHDVQFVSEEIEAEMSRLLPVDTRRPLVPLLAGCRSNAVVSFGYPSLAGDKILVDVATQTLSTGEIMATKFYHEGMA